MALAREIEVCHRRQTVRKALRQPLAPVSSACQQRLAQCKNSQAQCKNIKARCKNSQARCKHSQAQCKNSQARCKNSSGNDSNDGNSNGAGKKGAGRGHALPLLVAAHQKSHGPATKKKDTPLAPPIAPGNAAHLTGRAGQGTCELRKAPPAGTPGRLPGAARGRSCPHQPAHTQLCGAQGGSSPRPRADGADNRSARADSQEPALPGGG